MEFYSKSIVGSSGVNGDKCYVSDDKTVFAVADGASGAKDKVYASLCCIKALEELPFNSSEMKGNEYINYSINMANKYLIQKSQADGKLSFGTFTLSVYDKGLLYTGAVGDTPGFLFKKGKIIQLTNPKKRYSNAVEHGVITQEEAERMVKSLGPLQSAFEYFLPMIVPEIASSSIQINPGDVLIICCDGVSDWVKPEEMELILGKHKYIEDACEEIMHKSEVNCTESYLDDRTIVAVRF